MKIAGYIRCGTADCGGGFRLPDLSAERMERCYAEFLEIQKHLRISVCILVAG